MVKINQQNKIINVLKVANRLNNVQEYYFSQKLREIDALNKAGKHVINLGIGSPDLAPHSDVIRVLQEETNKPNHHAYQSYKGSPVLRTAMANWYKNWYDVNLDPEHEVLPLMGSKEGIMHICMTYLNEGDAALVPDPGYPAYSSAVKMAGANPVVYALSEQQSWMPTLDTLNALLLQNSNIKLMFVNYPHMPTGQLPTRAFFTSLVHWAIINKVLLVHDNPYSFILNDQPMSLLSVPGAIDVSLELNSLSKSHNMAGWRIGMLAGKKERLLEVLRFKSNLDSGMFLPLQLAAAKALSLEKSWYEQVNAIYRQRREKVFELLNVLQCTYQTNQAGMFVWAAIPSSEKDGFTFADKILEQTCVFITPGGIFGASGNSFIRVSLCSPIEIFETAINRVKTYLLNLQLPKNSQID